AAKVGELLPALDNVVEEVVELADEAVGAGPEHVEPRLELVDLVLDAAVAVLALLLAGARRHGALHLLVRRLHGGARAPELVHPDAPPRRAGATVGVGLLRHPLLQHCDGRHEPAGVRGAIRGARPRCGGGAGDGAGGEDEEQQRAGVVQRVEQAAEAVEAAQPGVRGAQQQPLVELQRQRRDPRLRQRTVLLLRRHGLPPRRRDRPHHLHRSNPGEWREGKGPGASHPWRPQHKTRQRNTARRRQGRP
ncbi:Os01g0875150, partial [Oryza sativa Japonica Group]